MTILSVNKTREMRFSDGRIFAPICFSVVTSAVTTFFIAKEQNMKNTSRTTRIITQAAVIAALNTVLTYAQYLLWPESTSMAIQVRISEAMLVLAFFTPAAVPGMTIGCLLFNLTVVHGRIAAGGCPGTMPRFVFYFLRGSSQWNGWSKKFSERERYCPAAF